MSLSTRRRVRGVRLVSVLTLFAMITSLFALTPPQVAAATCTSCTLWSDVTVSDVHAFSTAYEFGLKFKSDRAGYISAIRFYKPAGNTSYHTASLWTKNFTGTAVLLASAQFMNETASGWQEASFGTGVAIEANVEYYASYHSTQGPYAISYGYFSSHGQITSSPLTALGGTYIQGNSTFPGTENLSDANFWVAPVFNDSRTEGIAPTANPNVVNGVSIFAPGTESPMSYSPGVYELGTRFRSTRDGYINSIQFYALPQMSGGIFVGSLWSSSGTLLGRGTIQLNSFGEMDIPWVYIPLPVSVPIVAHQEYIVSYHTDTGYAGSLNDFASPRFYSNSEYILYATANGAGGNGLYGTEPGAMPTGATGMNYWVDVDFSAAPIPDRPEAEGTARSIFGSGTHTTGIATASPPYELGIRFQSAREGYIQGVRFYKGATSTGEHIANLWTETGTLLASATFSAETASGWQKVTFAQSVPISANTTYVASYHTTSGYAYTPGYFQSFGASAPPLRTLKSGGVYRMGNTGFPNQTYQDTNYWVDVVFGDMPAYVKPIQNATVFPDTMQPEYINSGGSLLQLGMKVRANRDGFIKGLHYYNASAAVTSHTARLWSNTGTVLASKAFTNEPQVGWQYIYFDTPIAVTANITHVISYDTVDSYPSIGGGLNAPPPSASPALRALVNGEDGENGLYRYGTDFPITTYNGANYLVDVIFDSVPAVGQLTNPVSVSGIAYTDVSETELDGPTTPATVNFQEIYVYPQGVTLNGSVTYYGDTYNFDLYGNIYDSAIGGSTDKVGSLVQGHSAIDGQ